jgi:hypothetical protein
MSIGPSQRKARTNFHIFRNNLPKVMRTVTRVSAIASVTRILTVAPAEDCVDRGILASELRVIELRATTSKQTVCAQGR